MILVTAPTKWTNMIDSTLKKEKIIMMPSILKKMNTICKAKPLLMIEDKAITKMRRDISKEESMITTKTIESQTEVSLISEMKLSLLKLKKTMRIQLIFLLILIIK
jgi:hypothetical protein